MVDWLKMWDEKAATDNYFTQTGRGNSFTMYQFLLYIQDVQNALHLRNEDSLLDIGGGPGWVAMHLSPWVGAVSTFDYSLAMVEQAKKQTKEFWNIEIFQDNILEMKNVERKYRKVLVGSVLQYLNNIGEVKIAMQNIYNAMGYGGTAMFTHNPDASKKESHIASMPQTEESLKMENERLWIDHHDIFDITMDIGFREFKVVPINPLIWQSTHMFDFVVTR